MTNFAEFAFGSDPTSSASLGQYFVSAIDTDNDNIKEAILTIAVREGGNFTEDAKPTKTIDGIIYLIEGSLTLEDFNAQNPPAVVTLGAWTPGVNDPEAPGGYEWQRFRLLGSDGLPGKGFFRAKATTVAP